MPHPRPSYERVALVGCLCLFVGGCRSDAGEPAATRAPAPAASEPAVQAPTASAASANAAGPDGDCAGPAPPGTPLPHFEQRKLASLKEVVTDSN